jgi:protein gp37
MSAEIVQATAHEAKVRAERIRVTMEDVKELVVQAYQSRDWAALGYESWDSYCAGEFASSTMFQLPREERPQTVRSLRDSGLSLRAIASATNQSHTQIRRDLQGGTSGRENVPPPIQTANNGNGRQGIDGKVYPIRPLLPPGVPPAVPPALKPEPVMLTLRTHTGGEVPYPQPQARATFNQTDGDGISWAKWSWNPVTGCLHGCDYCYARDIANRWPNAYPAGFTPLFHHERLDAPANTVIPAACRDDEEWRRVFVCSMADLYGRWVPEDWIEQVHASMLASPQWQYILLTKFPDRYPGLAIPPGAWVGTSVDEQKRVRIAERAFRQIEGAAVKWLSLEPLLEPLEFEDLSMFDWVVIGAQTPNSAATDPDPEWVMRLTLQAKEAGCKVHWKPNIRKLMWFDEYPAGGNS